jgi:hypothetical protein
MGKVDEYRRIAGVPVAERTRIQFMQCRCYNFVVSSKLYFPTYLQHDKKEFACTDLGSKIYPLYSRINARLTL